MVVNREASCRSYVRSEISSMGAVSLYRSLKRKDMIHNVE